MLRRRLRLPVQPPDVGCYQVGGQILPTSAKLSGSHSFALSRIEAPAQRKAGVVICALAGIVKLHALPPKDGTGAVGKT
jgi:hypothetical protein